MFSNVLMAASDNVFVKAMQDTLCGELFVIFVILVLGYLLGRINIKGVSLGSSGVFIVALIAGILLSKYGEKLGFKWLVAISKNANGTYKEQLNGGAITSVVKNIGLALFVTAVGFISGPTFLRNFKKKGLSFVSIGATIVVSGTIIAIVIGLIDSTLGGDKASGILMGALTSTPGMSSAQGVYSETKDIVAAMTGLAYPFGVLGVVLFVQLMPKFKKANMEVEIEKMRAASRDKAKYNSEGDLIEDEKGAGHGKTAAVPGNSIITDDAAVKKPKKRITIDSLGFCVFSLAVALGLILGAVTIPLGSTAKFSLGTTGGALFVGIIFGHFGHAGRLSLEVPKPTLNLMRELGLVLFLTGSGIEGGIKFLAEFSAIYLLYGVILTMVPMIIGYILAVYVFKLDLLNALGAVCGGMTSTPALGALIHVSGTDEVAQSYAATYPISLLLLVLVPQVISWIL